MIVLVCGLPGAGKTTLAKLLAPAISAVHFDGDDVREMFGHHKFDMHSRIIQAGRMGWLCGKVHDAGHAVVASFVCPTQTTRAYFGRADYVIWVDRISSCQYEDTNDIFEKPRYDLRLVDGTPQEWLEWAIAGLSSAGLTVARGLQPALYVGGHR